MGTGAQRRQRQRAPALCSFCELTPCLLYKTSLDAWCTRQYDYYQRVVNGAARAGVTLSRMRLTPVLSQAFYELLRTTRDARIPCVLCHKHACGAILGSCHHRPAACNQTQVEDRVAVARPLAHARARAPVPQPQHAIVRGAVERHCSVSVPQCGGESASVHACTGCWFRASI